MHQQFKTFVQRLAQQGCGDYGPTQSHLAKIADEISSICQAFPIDASRYPIAADAQELEYPFAVSESGGPSLYLVSDAAGVASPPHEHQTWVVIVGLRGREVHSLYEQAAGGNRIVNKVAEVSVGAGDVLCMQASDIHSTQVGVSEASYHLHLYGKPLSLLPNFASRCYDTIIAR